MSSDPAIYVLDTNVLMDWQDRYYPVGRDLGISCINLIGLMRREQWQV